MSELFSVEQNGRINKKLFSVDVDGTSVDIEYLDINKRPKFTGYKIMHPWSLNIKSNLEHDATYTEPEDPNEIDVRFIDAVFTVKFDGSCGMIKWNYETQKWETYCRHDIKKDKNGVFDLRNKKDTWIECCEEPTDVRATHWPFFKPIVTEGDRWFRKASDCALKSLENITPDDIGVDVFTVEWMGEKINCKKCDTIYDSSLGSPHHAAVPHSSLVINVPNELRSFNGLKNILIAIPFIEGMVVYCKDGAVIKVRRDSYGMKWPAQSYTNSDFSDNSNPVFDFLNSHNFACKSLPNFVALSGIHNHAYISMHNK